MNTGFTIDRVFGTPFYFSFVLSRLGIFALICSLFFFLLVGSTRLVIFKLSYLSFRECGGSITKQKTLFYACDRRACGARITNSHSSLWNLWHWRGWELTLVKRSMLLTIFVYSYPRPRDQFFFVIVIANILLLQQHIDSIRLTSVARTP